MSGQEKILFLNRDENFLNSLGDSLRESGYLVSTAMEMKDAMAALSSNSIGLILCDNRLRDASGFDFLQTLKNDSSRQNIPFIFCVPLYDQGRSIDAFKFGASDYIVYPLNPEEIISRINEIFPMPEVKNEDAFSETDPNDLNVLQIKNPGQAPENEKREDRRISLQQTMKVEVSRNGILWMPGQVKNINAKGLFLKTAMLGKAGVDLYVRITIPSGTSVLKGIIRHIAFKNCDPSAGIGIEIEKSSQWKEFLRFVSSHMKDGKSAPEAPVPQKPSIVQTNDSEKTIIISTAEEAKEKEAMDTIIGPEKSRNISYEDRFYQSLIGKQLSNYKVVSFLGSGAMGGVFKGWDIALERTVALKVISFELSEKEKFRDMFIKEARFVSQLHNQNIAMIYHIGNENQILYFAMEFIEGVTLSEMIKKEEKLNTLEGLDYLITICEALDFVSKKKIIHRDIKPANIMITNQGVVKIVDFGVAKVVDVEEKTREGIVGSPFYVSPDAIEGRALDHRSDIYSLGASFYHAFTGFPPFEGETAEDVLLRHLHQEIIPLKKKNPKVSSSLGRIIEKMMAKKPEERYQNYNEIIKELKSLRSTAGKFEKLRNATLIFRVKK